MRRLGLTVVAADAWRKSRWLLAVIGPARLHSALEWKPYEMYPLRKRGEGHLQILWPGRLRGPHPGEAFRDWICLIRRHL
jgi:hypothetical protein